MTRARDLSSILAADGSLNISTSVNLADNEKAYFGTSNDLEIYHDGSNSYISEGGTGNLFLGATNLFLRSGTGETYIGAVQDGAVSLYHDNSAKLVTTATGAQINGQLNLENVDGAIVTGVKATRFGYSSGYRVTQVGDTSGYNSVSIAYDPSTNTSGDFTGTGDEVLFRNNAEFMTPNSANTGFHNNIIRMQDGKVGIGTSSPSAQLSLLGSSGNSAISFHSTTSTAISYMGSTAAGNYIIGAAANETFIRSDGVGIAFSANTGSSVQMRIDSSGITTVGGTGGAARLNAVAQNWPENAIAVYSANISSQTNFAGIAFFNQDADSPIGQVADIYTNPTGTLSLTASGNPAIQLKYGSYGISGGTPALTVDNAGRIGIGTASPTLDGSLAGLSVNASGTVLHIDDGDGATLKLTDPASGANRGLGISLQGTEAVISNCESGSLRFGTGNTERMRIDAAGRVTMPYQPSFWAYGASAYQAQSGGLAYSSTQFNTGGHYNTSTYRFTAPVAGLYYFSAAAIKDNNTAGGVVLVVNGTFNFAKDYTEAADRSSTVSSVIYLNANDYVFVNNEGNNTWYLADGYGFFSGCLIG